MYRLLASIKKELLILINDKVGLALMFVLPLLLVFIITIIQDSAFKIVNNNQISMLVANHDKGELGNELTKRLSHSGMFDVTENKAIDSLGLKERIAKNDALTGIYIAEDFTARLSELSASISTQMLSDFGIGEGEGREVSNPSILFVHDPVLQERYCQSIIGMVHAHIGSMESERMITSIYAEMGLDEVPEMIKSKIGKNHVTIDKMPASVNKKMVTPNATQHNVPAWTVFAMFFMVVSLGTNIVKERNSGSFLRIKTMPSSFTVVLMSKQAVYMAVGIVQVLLIFSMGAWVFPHIQLPELYLPANLLGMMLVTLLSTLTAVSYSLMIGAIAKTQEQANGIGAISIIILAALGGVWVPTFVMPEFMQLLSELSPLHWCIEGFYILFLKNGNWADLSRVMTILISFSLTFQLLTYLKFRIDKII
ncbi:ABC transporter permease [Carboxylicivirga sp. RSCT41]|uniref:ABC transporter permease n=1 Tax=Carboxylicivirga agarovorans TaxID=3417570 RepID=UPI003D3389A3